MSLPSQPPLTTTPVIGNNLVDAPGCGLLPYNGVGSTLASSMARSVQTRVTLAAAVGLMVVSAMYAPTGPYPEQWALSRQERTVTRLD